MSWSPGTDVYSVTDAIPGAAPLDWMAGGLDALSALQRPDLPMIKRAAARCCGRQRQAVALGRQAQSMGLFGAGVLSIRYAAFLDMRPRPDYENLRDRIAATAAWSHVIIATARGLHKFT